MVDQPIQVLLVDDEIPFVRMLKLVLEAQGYHVHSATSGRGGLELFRQLNRLDVVVLDRAMQEMNGEELAKEIKSFAPELPIVMITGNVLAIADHSHIDATLAKPFLSSELTQCMKRVMDKGVRKT